jgi:S-adenosylmethionine synthetase
MKAKSAVLPYKEADIGLTDSGRIEVKIADEQIVRVVEQPFNIKPNAIIRQLDLLRPIYRKTTNYGHFGKADLPWEVLSKMDQFKAAAGVR